MKNILMTMVVVLVASTPIACAETTGSMAEPDSRHCTYTGENYDLCHTDRHKDRGHAARRLYQH